MYMSIDSYKYYIKYHYVRAFLKARIRTVPSLSFSFSFGICRRGGPLWAHRWINRKPIHQSHEFFPGEMTGFIGSTRPLETPIGKPDIKKNISVTGPQQSLDPVRPSAAEKKQCIFLQGIKSVFQVYYSSKAVNSFAKV